MSEFLNTVLYQKHVENNAKFVAFGQWNMPVSYIGILQEHNHTRENASLFDICHMGEFRLAGQGLAKQMDSIFARPTSNLAIGACRYNFLLKEDGGILDDLIIYRLGEEDFFIVVNATTKDNDSKVIQSRLQPHHSFIDQSDKIGKIDLQGPKAKQALEQLGIDIESLPNYYRWSYLVVNGIDILVSRTGYTGELGYEFYLPTHHTEFLWDLLLSIDFVNPAGLGSRDTLRLEMGYPLYGHEMNRFTNPLESGFSLILKPRQDFIGEIIFQKPLQKKLIALEIAGRRAGRQGDKIFNEEGKEVGEVTSGSFSPSLQKVIALALIDSQYAELSHFEIPVRKDKLIAKVTSLPFYKNGSLRN